jgi:hypothetical protein
MSHEQAIELLPWFINGSLGEEEQVQVHEHAFKCIICRRELEALEVLGDHISEAAESIQIPALDMRNINARIDTFIDRQNRKRKIVSWFREMFSKPLPLAFAVQTVLVIVLATILLWSPSEDPEFTTLTQPQNFPDGTYVRVVFNPELTLSELANRLDEISLTIADGPSARGVYTLRVLQAMSEDERAQFLSNLQEDPDVLFAQWAVSK